MENRRYFNQSKFFYENAFIYQLSFEETALMAYVCYVYDQNISFNPKEVAKQLNCSEQKINSLMNELLRRKVIIQDFVDNNLIFYLNCEYTKPKQSLCSIFESQFKNVLSAKMVEKIQFLEKEYDYQLIIYALREIKLKNNFKLDHNSLDKIHTLLQQWKLKGYTAKDYESGKIHT